MVRNKSHAEQPLTLKELKAIKESGLISEEDLHFKSIRFAFYKGGGIRIVFRFENGFGVSVVKERFDSKSYTVIPLNQGGFQDLNTFMGWYKTCWSAKNVMLFLSKVEAHQE